MKHNHSFLIVFSDSPNIIFRTEWNAREPKSQASILKLKPAPYVIIHHSVGPGCETQAACQLKVKQFQVINISKNKTFFERQIFFNCNSSYTNHIQLK